MANNEDAEYLIQPIHVGSHVKIHSIVSKPELNGRTSFVVSRNEERWGVVLFELDCDPGTRKIWSLKPANLEPLASFKGLKVTPVGGSNDGGASHVNIEPFDFGRSLGDEKAEKLLVGNKMNWPKISFSFQTFYSKYSPYPDLFCYWNADSNGPIHPISGALSSNQEVRGPAIFVRAEPPKAQDVLAVSDNGNSSMSQVTSQDATQWTIELGVQELLDTFEFYKGNSFQSVDNTRALKRMMPKMNFMYFNK